VDDTSGPARRDAFGGFPGLHLGKSGFFRLVRDKRWWFVTPAGNAFLSFGLNHADPAMLCRPYAIDHWRKALGGFENEKDPRLLEGFRVKLQQDLGTFGMNTLGAHSPTWRFLEPFCPYIVSMHFVRISHWHHAQPEDFVDVFSDTFEGHCRQLASDLARPRRNDPYLLGYSFSDCPVLTNLDARRRDVCIYGDARPALQTWPRVLRNQSSSSPGKGVYVETMRKQHSNSIEDFNRTYQTHFGSFDDLQRAESWRPEVQESNEQEQRDNLAFLQRIVDHYYRTACDAIRTVDPNHLVFGDKLNMNTGVPDEILRTVGRHVDLIFYQHYGFYDQQRPDLDHWSRLTGKPVFNGDSCFSVPDGHMSFTLGPQLASQDERAQAFLDYARAVFARPDFVGWNWCGWIDSWEVVQKGRQHSGIQTACGRYHEPLRKAMNNFSRNMYSIARGENL